MDAALSSPSGWARNSRLVTPLRQLGPRWGGIRTDGPLIRVAVVVGCVSWAAGLGESCALLWTGSPPLVKLVAGKRRCSVNADFLSIKSALKHRCLLLRIYASNSRW